MEKFAQTFVCVSALESVLCTPEMVVWRSRQALVSGGYVLTGGAGGQSGVVYDSRFLTSFILTTLFHTFSENFFDNFSDHFFPQLCF